MHLKSLQRKISRLGNRIKSMSSSVRISLGIMLILAGIFWFLPVLGLWMLPLGLLVLSFDFPWARRGYLSIIVWLRKLRKRSRNSGDS